MPALTGYGPHLRDVSKMNRVMRYPTHTFALHQKPWQIQPFLIAPVLPNDTLKNALCQMRVVTDPIKSPLIGWWHETYIFYVKHRDLYERDLLVEMVMNPDADLSALDSPSRPKTYHANETSLAIDWVTMCLNRVVDEWFRYENEAADDHLIDTMPAASLGHERDWLDSAVNQADFITPFDEDLTSTVAGAGDETTAVKTSEIYDAMQRYEYARLHGLTDLTYEKFLESYGIRMPEEELHRPELIRKFKDWQYPVNTVGTSGDDLGVPSSAVSWVINFSADKARHFQEPGFIFGVTVARPKVYLKNVNSAAVTMMRDAFSWLPVILSGDPMASMRKQAASQPPLYNNTDAYWVDIKDLFLYGDQFINVDPTDTVAGALDDFNLIAMPEADLDKRYPTEAMADSLFVASTAERVRTDGVVRLAIASKMMDTTPNVLGNNFDVSL